MPWRSVIASPLRKSARTAERKAHDKRIRPRLVRQLFVFVGGSSARRVGGRYDDRVLDERDRAILKVLQEDARATFSEIGERAGLASSTVHERVRKLEQAGVVRGYRAHLDPEALGLFVTALVSVMPLDPRQPDDLPERVVELPEVEDCHSVAGDENYILKVRTRTTAELEEFLRRLREKAAVQTRTTIVLSTPFEHRPIAS
jgi:Lrp/AsnC family leucine-responsive transcriptional regulator